MAKITGKLDYSKLDIKRFYLPGLAIEETCPHCAQDFKLELQDNYPYAIKADGTSQMSYLCPQCEEEIIHSVKLKISIEL